MTDAEIQAKILEHCDAIDALVRQHSQNPVDFDGSNKHSQEQCVRRISNHGTAWVRAHVQRTREAGKRIEAA